MICADASDCLLPSESGDSFHDAHDNIHKPSHKQQVKKGECEAANEQKCDDSPSSKHGFLATYRAVFAAIAVRDTHPSINSDWATASKAKTITADSGNRPTYPQCDRPRNNTASRDCCDYWVSVEWRDLFGYFRPTHCSIVSGGSGLGRNPAAAIDILAWPSLICSNSAISSAT